MNGMNGMVTISLGYDGIFRQDIQQIRDELCEIAEKEATYLYRLAWRMIRHNCAPEHVQKCREEAHWLHMCGNPGELLNPFHVWEYAFKIR